MIVVTIEVPQSVGVSSKKTSLTIKLFFFSPVEQFL